MQECWATDFHARPAFKQILKRLVEMQKKGN
jgi:hypothetical protein